MSRRRSEYPLFFAIFLDLLGFGMLIADVQLRISTLVPKGWHVGVVVGAILASTFIVQTLVSPMWGRVSDRIGRKPIIVGCTLLSAGAMAVYGVADSIWVLLASRVLAGFSAANVAVAQAWVADEFEAEERTPALGRMGAAITAGLVVGPPLGGFVAKAFGSHSVGYLAASLSLLGAVVIAATLPSPPPRTETPEKAKTGANWHLIAEFPQLKRFVLIAIVAWCSLATLEGTFARLIHQLFNYDQRHFGLIFGYESALGVLVQGVLLAFVAKRIAEPRLLQISYAMQGLGLALNPLAGMFGIAPLIVLMVASTVYAFGSSVANPTVNGICSRLCPAERQGELFGLLQGTRSVGFVIGPVVGGAMFDFWAPLPYYFAGLVCVGAAVLVPTE